MGRKSDNCFYQTNSSKAVAIQKRIHFVFTSVKS